MTGPALVDLADPTVVLAVDEPDGPARLAAALSRLGAGPDTATVGCPSIWGAPRRARLQQALRALRCPARVVPRAVLIAGSHADPAARSCVVIERVAIEPVPVAAGDGESCRLWAAQLVVRTARGWQIERCAAGDAAGRHDLAALADTADSVFTDGLDDDECEAVADLLSPKEVVPIDRSLLAAHGHRFEPRAPLEFGFDPPPVARTRRGGTIAVGLVVTAVVLLGVLGAVARWPRPAAGAAQPTLERVGPAALQIPAGWRRTALSGDRPDDGRGLRAVFADAADGGRLIVVVTGLRPGATRESVAASLANRIAQRGDEVVVEFAADSTYGGRSVIGYREEPGSGPAIRWYVVVVPPADTAPADAAPGLQVSVGCQAGTGEGPIEPACRAAVASVRRD